MSAMLTRSQMIKSVSEQDSAQLDDLMKKMEEIEAKKKELEIKRNELNEDKTKLEENKQELGYDKMVFLEDGATSSDMEELSVIRETNIKYHKTESDVLIGDYIILYQYKGKREQVCRFDCGQL